MSPAGLSPLDTTYKCVGTCRNKDGPRPSVLFSCMPSHWVFRSGADMARFFFSPLEALRIRLDVLHSHPQRTTTSDSSSRSANKTCQVVRQTGNTGVCLKSFGWCLVKLVGLICYLTHININKICIIIIIIITAFVSFLSSLFHDGIFGRPNTEHWKSCSWGILSSKILKRMNEIRKRCGCRMTKIKNQEPKFHQLNVHNICVRENKVYSPLAASKYIGHI